VHPCEESAILATPRQRAFEEDYEEAIIRFEYDALFGLDIPRSCFREKTASASPLPPHA
jgi:hypothetical protein